MAKTKNLEELMNEIFILDSVTNRNTEIKIQNQILEDDANEDDFDENDMPKDDEKDNDDEKDEKDKKDKNDEKDKDDEKGKKDKKDKKDDDEEDKELYLKFELKIGNKEEEKKWDKDDVNKNVIPINFYSILKSFNYDIEKLMEKAKNTQPDPNNPNETNNSNETNEEKETRIRLIVSETITISDNVIEFSYYNEDSIETAEIIFGESNFNFNTSPNALESSISAFDKIYYDQFLSKIRSKSSY